MSATSTPAAAVANPGVAGWETMKVAVSQILACFFHNFCVRCVRVNLF
jgi:hypothetical protein